LNSVGTVSNAKSGIRRFIILASLVSILAPAGEDGYWNASRQRLARTMFRHDFENRLDPDTGASSPLSAVLNNSGWPDFWEPIREVDFPEYLLEGISVVPDDSGGIPGAYRDKPNHVLRIGFDGGRVGLRTREPVPVDPNAAYEFSLFVRDAGLRGARIQAGVEWLRVNETAAVPLRSDEIPDFQPGQTDWPTVPRRMLIGNPPQEANAARFFLILGRQPGATDISYRGEFFADDIVFRPIPRISIGRTATTGNGQKGLLVPVRYSGLFDNIPDPDNPGYFRGKRYSREITAADIGDRPIRLASAAIQSVEPDESGFVTENIILPNGRFGVYYLNIRLFDAENILIADTIRTVAALRPERQPDPLAARPAKPAFGVRAGSIPGQVLTDPDFFLRLTLNAGARAVKFFPWADSYDATGRNEYYRFLAGTIRKVKSAGLDAIGSIRPPAALFGKADLAGVMAESPEKLAELLSEAGRNVGLLIDAWQWGDDGDGSLFGAPPSDNFRLLETSLADFAGGMPVAANRLAGASGGNADNNGFPFRLESANLFFPDVTPMEGIWHEAAQAFPWLFEPYANERGRIYPPARLSRLAPAPPTDEIEARARERIRSIAWLTLESPPVPEHEPNSVAEKAQMAHFLIRAVQAAAIAPDMVFMGELFEPARGMLRPAEGTENAIENTARPIYLASGVLSELLEGAEYLGQFGLLAPFEAHVFRRAGTDEGIIALWHHEFQEERRLPRAEIAEGPVLTLIDWAGNREPLPSSIPVGQTPSFITGMSASLALTRMSVRIAPEPRLLSATRRQTQTLEVVNHLPGQTPVLFRLNYAARQSDGGMENSWIVTPPELRINLPPVSPAFSPGRLRLNVSPDPNSQTQNSSPGRSDKLGMKLARARMRVSSSQPADILLYLPFRLHSELDVDIEELPRVDDPGFLTLQLKIRWFPENRRRETRMLPYYLKKGGMKEPIPFPITLGSLPAEARGNPQAPFESVELRIPRFPAVQTWVGLREDGGNNFFLTDVTGFLEAR
jgi:hypothetical protein